MSSTDKEKIDELLLKLRSLGDRAKSTRAQFGAPLLDRVLERVGRISEKLPQHNGDSKPRQPEPEEAKISCPKCGVQAVQGANFCNACGLSFQEERRRQQREEIEREKCERTSRIGITS